MTDVTTPLEIAKAYEPTEVEARWVERWDALGVFRADVESPRPAFVLACPPPNVTGSLHMGHAVNGTVQDILARTKRMQGFEVLWQPGTDHAGIATQYVVEKKLYKETKQTRHDLGREAFLARVWEWKNESGDAIYGQYKRLGASLDYSRWRFTMDEGYSRAVRKAFVLLFNKGYIYRGNRMINWCPSCLTSLSDLEVAAKEQADALYHIRYPRVDGLGDVVVATVRPETMFGDVAVAVHPEDERYRALLGTRVRLPLTDRDLPVIGDAHVEPDFGTGCLKITPAHDMNDFEIGQRHGLETRNTLTPKGVLNEAAGAYAGLSREKARERVVADLEAGGYLVKKEDYLHNVGRCSRCDTVLEPYLSDQWFVRMAELAGPAIAAVERGAINFHPPRWGEVYLDWMRNIKDWNISRQLWWGHQIPVWYCPNGHVHAAETDLTACPTCGGGDLVRDADVLDTWFSSALWTYATLGWPDDTPELRKFHPTQVLSTARDIIYLWVARMIFTSLEFRDEIPFSDVIIHATILDPEGRRMSKSKGTGIDPLVVMDRYGTDAVRYWMAGAGTSSQDVRFREEKIETYRNFANKLWNASRFILTKAAAEGLAPPSLPKRGEPRTTPDSVVDRWILSRLHGLVADVTAQIERYAFAEATTALYEFTWNEFCDWYLELAKGRLDAGDSVVREVLAEVMDTLLCLLHPFMPFITEEIHQLLVARGWAPACNSLLRRAWPVANPSLRDEAAEREMGLLIDAVRQLRNMRAELRVEPAKLAPEVFIIPTEGDREAFLRLAPQIARMGRAEAVRVLEPEATVADDKVATGLVGESQVILPLAAFGDVLARERSRLEKELGALRNEQQRVAGQLANEAFVAKAPVQVVDKLRARAEEIVTQIETLDAQLKAWA
ncbi:MAG: valine--tRNA ligase [Candidatus Sericytochromatia bacterium]|nr:valine--tRNA ligase [Candidatus Sericytochromatia bacterium]